MAFSKQLYFGDGVNDVFGVPFPYLNRSHIKVFVGTDPTPVSFTWLSSGQVKLSIKPGMNVPVQVSRVTPRGERLVEFQDGSRFSARNSNLNSDQFLYIAQEMLDAGDTEGLIADLQALLDAAIEAAESAAQSAASIALPIPIESGGTGVQSLNELKTTLDIKSAASRDVGVSPGNLVEVPEGGRLPQSIVARKPGAIVQELYLPITAYATLAGVIPLDDTIPQITEGLQIVATSFTPSKATNRIAVEYQLYVSNNATSAHTITAVFKNTEPDALTVGWTYYGAVGAPELSRGFTSFIAGTVEPINIAVRGGLSVASTLWVNGNSTRLFGGRLASYLVIREVEV